MSDIAQALMKIFETDRSGLYHVCGRESISRYDFALRAANAFGLDATLIDRSKLSGLNQVAPRPSVTVFITLKAVTELGLKMMDVREGLMLMKLELQKTGRN